MVIATGGLSHRMYDLGESIDEHEPDLTLIGLRLVAESFIRTRGGPLGSTTTVVYPLYGQAFSRFRLG